MMLSLKITHLRPCSNAVEWLDKQKTPQQAWVSCHRGDWMLWLIGKQITSQHWSDDRKPLLACALDCAETVKHLWPKKSKDRIEKAILVLRGWIEGKSTIKKAKVAKQNLYAAHAAADAADAAYAAAHAAADAADAAAYAAAYAYAAANAAANAAADARTKSLQQTADIIRKHYPISPIL